jgi:hypothetical protein
LNKRKSFALLSKSIHAVDWSKTDFFIMTKQKLTQEDESTLGTLLSLIFNCIGWLGKIKNKIV